MNDQPTLPYLLDDDPFPDIELAWVEPNGLLAMGADLSVPRLLKAYQSGIFPWYSHEDPLLWWSPDPRAVINIGEFKPSTSLKKFHRKQTNLRVTKNEAFDHVIEACAHIPRQDNGTWITDSMIEAYKTLHRNKAAHSIEVWFDDELVGGLYGVGVGAVFCGESMFHKASNASKIAFWYLNMHLAHYNYQMIDCQLLNPHLSSLGVYEIPRVVFSKQIRELREASINATCWVPGEIQDRSIGAHS
ncbi:leucyl/phenylalanyl-tRNA--protein transferase [Alteromonadaceae bacterium M269]|nr:leucyl/phenylalanyl-tRNA--protein transferase [Alteromonadaceae bacterium M269]